MTNTSITEKDVIKIADLARLRLSKKEVRMFRNQFNEIFSYMDELNEVQTQDIEPTSQVTGLINVFRDDISGKSMPQSTVIRLSPSSRNGYVVVPAVFNTNDTQ